MNGKQAKKLRCEAYINDFVHAQHNRYERIGGTNVLSRTKEGYKTETWGGTLRCVSERGSYKQSKKLFKGGSEHEPRTRRGN